MTPSQLDHLNRIKAHLETLLTNAEKRTPGEWTVDKNLHDGGIRAPSDHVFLTREAYLDDPDAAFIASCAGNAEAGWRRALAEIELINLLSSVNLSPCNGGSCMVATNAEEYLEAIINKQLNDILTTWPLESLIL